MFFILSAGRNLLFAEFFSQMWTLYVYDQDCHRIPFGSMLLCRLSLRKTSSYAASSSFTRNQSCASDAGFAGRAPVGGDCDGVRPPDADPGGHGAGGAARSRHLRLRGHRHRQDGRLHAAHSGAARLQTQTGEQRLVFKPKQVSNDWSSNLDR